MCCFASSQECSIQILAERNANFETEMVLVLSQTSEVNIVCLVLFYFFFPLNYLTPLTSCPDKHWKTVVFESPLKAFHRKDELSGSYFWICEVKIWCGHSLKKTLQQYFHMVLYIVLDENFSAVLLNTIKYALWVCGRNSMVWTFKWNLFSCTFTSTI